MPDTPDRRNPLRLIVSKETQLHILWLVGGGIFFCMAATMLVVAWVKDWVWVVTLALGVGAFVSLYVSRRIAGPFYRIEKDLEDLLNGALTGRVIQIRPNDPLQRLTQLVNALIQQTKPTEQSPSEVKRSDH